MGNSEFNPVKSQLSTAARFIITINESLFRTKTETEREQICSMRAARRDDSKHGVMTEHTRDAFNDFCEINNCCQLFCLHDFTLLLSALLFRQPSILA